MAAFVCILYFSRLVFDVSLTGDNKRDDSSLTPLNPREAMKMSCQARKKKDASNSSHKRKAATCVDTTIKSYLTMKFEPVSELRAQYKRTGKDPTSIDWGRVENLETLYISSLFDSIEWWKEVGSEDHPQVFPVFPAVIAQPASNDFQE